MKPGLAAWVLAAALCGCVNNEISVSIVRFVAPLETECTADPTSMLSTSRGVLDVSIRGTQPYVGAPVVTNNLANRIQNTGSQLDAVFLVGFDVELVPDVNDAVLQAAIPADRRQFYYAAAGGRIEPGGTSTTATFVDMVPAATVQLIAAAIPSPSAPGTPLIVRIRPVATHAGATLVGGWVPYPVTFCSGCLVDAQACPGGGLREEVISNGGCFLGQDAIITCCDNGTCGANIPRTMM